MSAKTITVAGYYYVKLYSYDGDPAPTSLTVQLNGQQIFEVSDFVTHRSIDLAPTQLNLQGACTLQIDDSGTTETQMLLYAPGADATDPGAAFATETPSTANTLTASPNAAGNWFIVASYDDPGDPVT